MRPVLKLAAFIAVGYSALAVSTASANKCISDYRHNLNQIAKHGNRLANKCWIEVQKGERNADKIIQVCSGPDMQRVMIIRQHKVENRSLCQSSCRSDLSSKGLCVDNKPLSYYLSKASL